MELKDRLSVSLDIYILFRVNVWMFLEMTGIICIPLKSLTLLLDCFMKCPKDFTVHEMTGFPVATMLCYTAPQTNEVFRK